LFNIVALITFVNLFPFVIDGLNALFPQISRIPLHTAYVVLVVNVLMIIGLAIYFWVSYFFPVWIMLHPMMKTAQTIHVLFLMFVVINLLYHYFSCLLKKPGFVEPVKMEKDGNKVMDGSDVILKGDVNDVILKGDVNDDILKGDVNVNKEILGEKEVKVVGHLEDDRGSRKRLINNEKDDLKEGGDKKNMVEKKEDEDELVTSDFCKRCNFKRTERCNHCKYCKKCVKRMDHHCPFIGACVGEGNHYHFLMFLLFFFFGTIYSCYMSYIPFMVCYVFNEKQNGVCQFIGEFDLIFVCTFFGASFIGIINVWQYYVILTDITTVEMILVLRKKEKKAWIPYIIETFIKNASFKKR